ncbi:MAG: NUDIX hydrolase [Simkaniaceae bacterium]|nr:NUDIX hydrolase [Candidatus Sacchlamyda saccharinae]
MAATSAVTTIPGHVDAFFTGLYGEKPQAETVDDWGKKTTTFSLEGKPVKVLHGPFKDIHVEVGALDPVDVAKVAAQVDALYKAVESVTDFNVMWVNFQNPAGVKTVGAIVPEAFQLGAEGKSDCIHDQHNNQTKYWRWLNADASCRVPSNGGLVEYGATAALIDSTAKKVLLVDASRGNWLSFPGGRKDKADPNCPAVAIRETKEETKVEIPETATPTLVAKMQFPENQLNPAINETWAFDVPGASTQEVEAEAGEIKKVVWLSVDEILRGQTEFDGKKIGAEITAAVRAWNDGTGFAELKKDGNWKIVHGPATTDAEAKA